MSKKRKKGKALSRRYGHFGMADIHKASSGVRKFGADHPYVAGAALGAVAGAIAAGAPPTTAALAGAVVGIAAQEATRK